MVSVAQKSWKTHEKAHEMLERKRCVVILETIVFQISIVKVMYSECAPVFVIEVYLRTGLVRTSAIN